jgi:hypothetical protein
VVYRGTEYTSWTELSLDSEGEVFDCIHLKIEPGAEYMHRVFGAARVSWEGW